jgi:hypothetical protein
LEADSDGRADLSKRNPFVPIPINQNLYYLLENLKRYASIAVHRVPIVSLDEQVSCGFDGPVTNPCETDDSFGEQDPKIMAMVTQSDVASYLAKHISVLGPRYACPSVCWLHEQWRT